MKRYKRGLGPDDTPDERRGWLKNMEETCVWCSALEALFTIASVPMISAVFCTAIWWLSVTHMPIWMMSVFAIIGYVVVITVIARQQRVMELMVHDASHGCWHRASKWINDLLADWLIAVPVLSSVKRYWSSHRPHHGAYGGHLDPCRKRFEAMGLGHLDLSTSWKITWAVLRWLPQYNAEYYREIGSLSFAQFGKFVLWHVAVLMAPLAVGFMVFTDMTVVEAFPVAFVFWVLFWMIPSTLSLPVIRSIAESEEHDYDRGDNEYDTTYTNRGFWHRVLFHPANDAYHLIHHMYPNIPMRVHHKVHKYLMQNDPKYRSSLHRTQILQQV